MAKLSFSIALNLLTQGVQRGAKQVEATFKRMKTSISGVFGTLGMGLGLGAFARQAVDAGKNFEDAMARVRAVSNATSKDFERMSNEAKKLGATTRYSASEAASALENLVRNGLNPGQATAALPKVLQLAQANSIELAEAADICTNTMNEFGLAVDKMALVNDTMSSTAAHSATNITDLGMAMTTAAPLANNLKIGITETASALGVLANVGIKGADAGTAMKQIFMGLSTSTPQSEAALRKYGLVINQDTIAAEGLTKTLEKMAKSGIGKNNQDLADVFGRKAFAGAASLINNYEKFVTLNTTLSNSQGETQRMFEQGTGKMLDSIKSLQSAWEGFQIAIFDSSESILTGPVDAITSLVRYLTSNLGDVAAKIAIIFGGSKIVKAIMSWSVTAKASSAEIVADAMKSTAQREALERKLTAQKKSLAKIDVQIAAASESEKTALAIKRNAKLSEIEDLRTAITKAQSAERVAIERATAVQTGSVWQASFAKIKSMAAAFGTAMKGIWAAAGPMVLITLVTELIFKLKELYDGTQRVKDVATQYATELRKATHTREINQLKQLQDAYNKTKSNSRERLALEGKISSVLGVHLRGANDINKALSERLGLLRKAAEMEFYTNKSLDTQQQMEDIKGKYGGIDPRTFFDKNGMENKNFTKYLDSKGFLAKINPFAPFSAKNDANMMRELEKQYKNASSKATALETSVPTTNVSTSTALPSFSGASTTATKTEAEYVTELKSLKEQYRQQKATIEQQYKMREQTGMTESEYQKALKDLSVQTYIQTQTSKYNQVQTSKFADEMLSATNSQPSESAIRFASIAERVGKALKEYESATMAGVESQEVLDKTYHDVLAEAIKEASTLSDLSDAQKNMIGYWQQSGILLEGTPSLAGAAAHDPHNIGSTRDKTFDYKLTRKERLELDLDYAKEQLDTLKSQASESLQDLTGEINDMESRVGSLSDMVKIEQFKEDLHEASAMLVDNLGGALSLIDGVKDGVQGMIETLNSPDADGWEKMISVFDTLLGTISAIIQIYEAFQAIQQAINVLSATHAAITTEEAVAQGANVTAQGAAAAASTVQSATAAATIPINKAAAAAAEELAASNIFLAHSYIPFAGVPIASGMVGTMQGVLASVRATSAFAGGGIVKGNPFDRSLAAVSDGEMIMNGTQQQHLWNAIKTGNFGGGGLPKTIVLKAKGRDLVGVIRNENSKMDKV